MANSAIRIPIPGSIIDAINAIDGDLLYFNSVLGQGGSFVNFKPLVQDLRPFTKNSQLDFYVSVKSETETDSWQDATERGMVLASGLDNSGNPVQGDVRLGINLDFGRPTHTLEVVGDLMVWGSGSEAGKVLGRVNFYSNETETPQPSFENLVFGSPLKNYSETELDAVQSRLQAGNLLVRHPDTKDTYFARLEDIAVAGNGITVNNNIISVGGNFQEISSPFGLTIRLDTDRNGGENDALRVVEQVSGPGGLPLDFSLMRVVRGHGNGVTWNSTTNRFEIGTPTSQGWPTVKMSVGTGTRLTPNGLVVEDGVPVTGAQNQEGYETNGSKYARLFGAVTEDPSTIVVTGPINDPASAYYFDTGRNVASTVADNDGRFGFLPGIVSMSDKGGYADPGSFVAGFLNKHSDGGGVKIKSGDTNGDEFALFLENSQVAVDTAVTGGQYGELSARHLTIVEDTDLTGFNDRYRNILAKDAPVFTVRATSGDTFVRGFLVMPFLPGIQSDTNGKPESPGAVEGEIVLSTVEHEDLSVSMIRYQWNSVEQGGGGDWTALAEYKLPKGTLYCDATGNVKIARGGSNIRNHGLDGVTSWSTSD